MDVRVNTRSMESVHCNWRSVENTNTPLKYAFPLTIPLLHLFTLLQCGYMVANMQTGGGSTSGANIGTTGTGDSSRSSGVSNGQAGGVCVLIL